MQYHIVDAGARFTAPQQPNCSRATTSDSLSDMDGIWMGYGLGTCQRPLVLVRSSTYRKKTRSFDNEKRQRKNKKTMVCVKENPVKGCEGQERTYLEHRVLPEQVLELAEKHGVNCYPTTRHNFFLLNFVSRCKICQFLIGARRSC